MDLFNTKTTPQTTDTWLTPPYLLSKLGKFDLDPCAAINRPCDPDTLIIYLEIIKKQLRLARHLTAKLNQP